jgi:N-acetylglucosaminyldiphosphoundecaprenol N-acetyl-beta-D-mannosaminyltransferase
MTQEPPALSRTDSAGPDCLRDGEERIEWDESSIRQFGLGGIRCSPHTVLQLLDEVRLLLRDKFLQPRTLLTVNAHIYNLACKDPWLRHALNTARIVSADGMSIVWASRLFGARLAERCNATEAFRAFLLADDMPRNRGILVGCTDSEARSAGDTIEKMSDHCRIIRTVSGYLSARDYETVFRSLRDIDFIFLGMGTPKTEAVSEVAKAACPQAIVWGIGGGTIRILAGTMKEAPVFLRRIGLQWLHRLYCDPRNLWRRYVIGNPVFIYKICEARLRSKSNNAEHNMRSRTR